MAKSIVLTAPVIGDQSFNEQHALDLMQREIDGSSNGGWKYKDKALQADHEEKVKQAELVRNAPAPPVIPQPKTDAATRLSDKGNTKGPEAQRSNSESGNP